MSVLTQVVKHQFFALPNGAESAGFCIDLPHGTAHSARMLVLQSIRGHLRNVLLAMLVLSSVVACGGEAGGPEAEATLHIAFYRDGCSGEGSFFCLLASLDSESYSYFYDAIEGFNFQWGYRYTLRVRLVTDDNPPADGSGLRYTLIEELTRQAATDVGEFTVRVPSLNVHVEKISGNLYAFSDGKEFQCNGGDCATLDSLIAQGFWAAMVFELAADVEAPMILKRIICADTEMTFFTNCS